MSGYNSSQIDKRALKLINDFDSNLTNDIAKLKSEIEKETDVQRQYQLYKHLGIFQNFKALFLTVGISFESIIDIKDAIDRLPKKDEFEDVKKKLQSTDEKIKSTLEPIKKLYDQYQESEKRVGDYLG